MAAAKSKAIEKDVDGLISCITGFSDLVEEDQENFELCRRYVLSNIYYHRYLDTNSHEVRRQLRGLATKFRVHALPDRADRLETLWSRLVDTGNWAEHSQWDIEWRLLSLLVNLSHRPTSLAARQQPAAGAGPQPLAVLAEDADERQQQQQQEDDIDWERELQLPADDWSPYQSPEEWSDLEDDDDITESQFSVHHRSFHPYFAAAGARPAGAEGRPSPGPEEDPLTWLEGRITRSYQPAELGPGPLRPTADGAETYHALQLRMGLASCGDVVKVSEWMVCRELVWQLLAPTESPLLELHHGQLQPSRRFRVHGLTEAGLSSLLGRLCGAVNAVSRLRRFVRSAGPLSTHRAFAASLTSHLAELDAELVALDTQLERQEVPLTLLGLQRRLSDWMAHLVELDRLLQRGVTNVDPGRPPWIHTARLVSVLYEAVEVCSDERWSAPLVRLFLDTVQPLLAIVSGWTTWETEPDPSREFIIERNDAIAVTDARYWSDGFTVHSRCGEWWTDGVRPLPFLLPHLDHVVQTAKCLRILCHLRLTDHLDDSSIQDEFNRRVGQSLALSDPPPPSPPASASHSTAVPSTDPEGAPAVPVPDPGGTPSVPLPDLEGAPSVPLPDPGGIPAISEPDPKGIPADPSPGSKDAASIPPLDSEGVAADPLPDPEGAPAAPPPNPEGPLVDSPPDPEGAPAAPPPDPEGAPAAPPPDPEGAPVASPPDPEGAPAAPPPDPEGALVDSPPDPEGAPAAPPPDPEGAPAAPPPDPEGAPSEDSGRGSDGVVSPPPGGLLRQLLASCDSPYLTAAFEDVIRTMDGDQKQASDRRDRAAPAARLTTALPHVVSAALAVPLAARQAAVVSRVVAALRTDSQLGEHLRMLRRVLLMEAGDLMAEFIQQLCRTLSSGSTDDESVRLTLCLEECVSGRHPQLAPHLSVTVPPEPEPQRALLQRLEAVTIGYSAPWPCSIVITDHCLSKYNGMFRFILQLKVTLRDLQTLSFSELAAAATAAEEEGSLAESLLRPDGSAPVPRASRILRLQLLRAWLLHYVGSVHSHIMLRVLHSSLLELEEQLDRAADVDSLVRIHSLYLDVLYRRCLLSGSVERTLHSAVQSGLQVAGRLVPLWTAGRLAEADLLSLEADYVRCHRLTAGLLHQYRQTESHVDGLAAALAHSAPSQVSHQQLLI